VTDHWESQGQVRGQPFVVFIKERDQSVTKARAVAGVQDIKKTFAFLICQTPMQVTLMETFDHMSKVITVTPEIMVHYRVYLCKIKIFPWMRT